MRSDGDTWDIVSSVGRTALGVAAFRAVETDDPDRLIQDDYARMFVAAAGDPHFTAVLADPSLIGERNFFPRMVGPRTKFFDEFFLAAAKSGARQAVILAAGLDARAYRLDWPTGTTVFEVDQAKVLEFKDRVLVDNAAQPKADRRTVAVDLREDWPTALQAAGLDAASPTAWSVEGLLPYLPGAAQDRLFEQLDALSSPGSRLAGHDGPVGQDAQRFRELAERYFDRNPFGGTDVFDLWYDDERADPAEWLTAHNWTVHKISTAELFESYGRTMPELPDLPPDLDELRNRMAFWTAVKS